MKNSEIVKILYLLALFDEMKDELFKARAQQNPMLGFLLA